MVEHEQFLSELYRNLEQHELTPDDPRYVAIESYGEAFGPDVVADLSKAVAWTTEGSVFFLSGTRGSGKSTQLLRLRDSLERRGFAAVRLDAGDYLNLRQPVEVVEFLYFMVGAISDAIAESGWIPAEQALEQGWGGLRAWMAGLRHRVKLTPELELGGGVDVPGIVSGKLSLKAELSKDESFVAELRRFLGARVSEFADQANQAVAGLVDALREAWPRSQGGGWKGLVVLVDSLDHVRGVDFHEVRRALAHLLDTQSETIRLGAVRTVFIVPPWVLTDYAPMRRLANVKVHDRDQGSPYAPGLEALRELVRRRTPGGDVSRLFADPAELDQLLLASGGHLRDVLRLVRDICVAADTVPFDAEAIARGRQAVRDGMLPLADDERECLRLVARDHQVPLKTQAEWEALAGLFDRHLVLGYRNGETWFDVHPLVAGDVRD